jgi:ribulose-phosphate 3-epimerase
LAIICPTVTTSDRLEYDEQVKVADYASRVHIDLSDGVFTESSLITVDELYLPKNIDVDVHLMYQRPSSVLVRLLDLRPQMIIAHFEASDDLPRLINEVKECGLKAGLAILQETTTEMVANLIPLIDHLLIFSGSLGSFGGNADLNLLDKVKEAKLIKPELEVGWDGGVNADVALSLAKGGVDVLNVGSYIQESVDPKASFDELNRLVGAS